MEKPCSYSREATVAAFRDYYDFCKRMYLDDAFVVGPPEGGWPSITPETMQPLGKSDEVIALLHELPYISPYGVHASAQCTWADWDSLAQELQSGKITAKSIKITTKETLEVIPPQVFSITSGGGDNDIFYLDTIEGNVYWLDCPSDIRENPEAVRNQSSPWIYDDEDDSEGEWRHSQSTAVWTIPDFFEIMKDELRQLRCIPLNEQEVDFEDAWPLATELARRVFHEHGWPDLDRYRKSACITALKQGLESEMT